MASPAQPVTQLLQAWRNDDQNALNALMPVVYDQMRSIAELYLRAENPGHTLGATEVVHEAFIRLVDADAGWEDRAHFLAIAARVMRRILVDHARANSSDKQGRGASKISLDDALVVSSERAGEVLNLDEALTRLSAVDARKSRILEMLYFGGLTYEETAEAEGVSPVTVHRELKMAKAWLRRELGNSGE